MTVGEMSPIELYSVVFTALVVFALMLLGFREVRKVGFRKESAIAWFGLAVGVGLPVIITLRMFN